MTRHLCLRFCLVLACAAALATCFNPDISGPETYLCSSDPHSCPDDYTCLLDPLDKGVCRRTCKSDADCTQSSGYKCLACPTGTGSDETQCTPAGSRICAKPPDCDLYMTVADDAVVSTETMDVVAWKTGVEIAHISPADVPQKPRVIHRHRYAGDSSKTWAEVQTAMPPAADVLAGAALPDGEIFYVFGVQPDTKGGTTTSRLYQLHIGAGTSGFVQNDVDPFVKGERLLGLDVDADPDRGAIAIAAAGLTMSSSEIRTYTLGNAGPARLECDSPEEQAILMRPRVSARKKLTLATLHRSSVGAGTARWDALGYSPGATCTGPSALTTVASTIPSSAPLVLAGNDFPHVLHAVWPGSGKFYWLSQTLQGDGPPKQVNQPEEVDVSGGKLIPTSLDLVLVNNAPVVSFLDNKETTVRLVVAYKDVKAAAWKTLSLPLQAPKIATASATTTRMAVDTQGRVHVIHDGYDKDTKPSVFYARCKIPR